MAFENNRDCNRTEKTEKRIFPTKQGDAWNAESFTQWNIQSTILQINSKIANKFE